MQLFFMACWTLKGNLRIHAFQSFRAIKYISVALQEPISIPSFVTISAAAHIGRAAGGLVFSAPHDASKDIIKPQRALAYFMNDVFCITFPSLLPRRAWPAATGGSR